MVEQAEEHELKFDQKTSYSCGVFVEERVVGQILDMVEDSDKSSSRQWVLFPTEPELHSHQYPEHIRHESCAELAEACRRARRAWNGEYFVFDWMEQKKKHVHKDDMPLEYAQRVLNDTTAITRQRETVSGSASFPNEPRIPVYLLFNHLAKGKSIDDFLAAYSYSKISREDVVAVVDLARDVICGHDFFGYTK